MSSSQELSNQSAPSRLTSPCKLGFAKGPIEWYDSPGPSLSTQELSQRNRLLKLSTKAKSADSFCESPGTSTLNSPLALDSWWDTPQDTDKSESVSIGSNSFADQSALCTDISSGTPRSCPSAGASRLSWRRHKRRTFGAGGLLEKQPEKEEVKPRFGSYDEKKLEAAISLGEKNLEALEKRLLSSYPLVRGSSTQGKPAAAIRKATVAVAPTTPRSRSKSATDSSQPLVKEPVNRKRPAPGPVGDKVLTPSISRVKPESKLPESCSQQFTQLCTSTPISGTSRKRFCAGQVLSPIADSTPLSLRKYKTTSQIPAEEKPMKNEKKEGENKPCPSPVFPRSMSMTSQALDDSFYDDDFFFTATQKKEEEKEK